jgi:hypothetical protein
MNVNNLFKYTLGAIVGAVAGWVVGQLVIDSVSEEYEEIEPGMPSETKEAQDESVVQIWEPKKKTKPQVPITDYVGFQKRAKVLDGKKLIEEEVEKLIDKGYVISLEDFSDTHDEYAKVQLSYYEDDEVVVDDKDSILSSPEDFLGFQALTMFGKDSEDPDIVFVRNDTISTDYEIVRLHTAYSSAVLGLKEEEPVKKQKGNKKKTRAMPVEEEDE